MTLHKWPFKAVTFTFREVNVKVANFPNYYVCVCALVCVFVCVVQVYLILYGNRMSLDVDPKSLHFGDMDMFWSP